MISVNDDLFLGVDCGATKIMVQSGFLSSDSNKIIPGPIHQEYHYSDHPDWNEHYDPVPIDIQRFEYASDNISLEEEEIKQGNVIIDTIVESIANIDGHKIGLCFPGIKDDKGVTVMANGPRIPELNDRINKIETILNDSDCCVLGEWKSTIGKMQDMHNGIYIGGGTGIADGVIVDGNLLDLNKVEGLPRSWEMNINTKETVESRLSPAGIIRRYNKSNGSKITTLIDLSNEKAFNEIIEKALDAFSLLVKNRIQFCEIRGQKIQGIVIGHRLGQFLKNSDPAFKKEFQNRTKIPIKLSNDRRTAALGAAMAIACS